MKNNDLTSPSQSRYDGYYKYDASVAETYDESRKNEYHWRKEVQFIKRYINKNKINNLLDLPVGTGRFLPYYKGVGSVTGVDISEAMLEKARGKCALLSTKKPVRLEKGDVLALPYTDMEFDVAIVFRLFHLMPDKLIRLAIQELCRVVRKDIIAQTYVPLDTRGNRGKSLQIAFHKAFSLLRQRTHIGHQNVRGDPPWLHIQSFYHTQQLFNSIFRMYGFIPSFTKMLDIYGHCEVRVTVFSRDT